MLERLRCHVRMGPPVTSSVVRSFEPGVPLPPPAPASLLSNNNNGRDDHIGALRHFLGDWKILELKKNSKPVLSSPQRATILKILPSGQKRLLEPGQARNQSTSRAETSRGPFCSDGRDRPRGGDSPVIPNPSPFETYL